MKKTLLISIISIAGGVLLVLSLTQIALGKGHVPANKGQLCAQGLVLTVSEGAVRGFTQRGTHGTACILPACDFGNIFTPVKGCDGLIDANDDGLCDLPNARIPANTPSCGGGRY